MKFTFKELRMLLTEQVRTIETTIKILQNSASSARYISPLINRSAITLHDFIQQRTLISLKYGQITSALRSTVHFQSNFNLIACLECAKVISQLLSISVLSEERSNRSLFLTSAISINRMASPLIRMRNILLTDRMTINYANSIANLQILRSIIIETIVKIRDIYINTIRLLAAQLNGRNIALIGVHITLIRSPINQFTQKMILNTEIIIKLKVSGEINANIANLYIQTNTGIISEEGRYLKTVSVSMRTQLFNFNNVPNMLRHIKSILS